MTMKETILAKVISMIMLVGIIFFMLDTYNTTSKVKSMKEDIDNIHIKQKEMDSTLTIIIDKIQHKIDTIETKQ